MRSINASKVVERSCQLRRVGPELGFAHSNCTLDSVGSYSMVPITRTSDRSLSTWGTTTLPISDTPKLRRSSNV
jgi:hypothetical protein